jgi:hypothetical protein
MPDWMKDHVATSVSAAPNSIPAAAPVSSSVDWILDFVATPSSSATFSGDYVRDRAVVFISLGGIGAIVWFAGPTLFSLIAAAAIASCLVGFLRYQYSKDPIVKEAADRKDKVVELALNISDEQKKVKSVEEGVAKERQELDSKLGTLRSALTGLARDEQAEADRLNLVMKGETASDRDRTTKLTQQETDERTALQTRLGAKVNDLIAKVRQLATDENDLRRKTLETKRKVLIEQYLRSKTVWSASIPGIGHGYKSRLDAAGFRTAADITPSVGRVQGIGQARAAAILAWKDALFKKIYSQLPSQLDPQEDAAITAKYRADSARQSTLLQIEQEHLTRSLGEVRSKYAGLRAPLDTQIKLAQAKLQTDLKRVQEEYAGKRTVVQQQISAQQIEIDKVVQRTNLTVKDARAGVMKLQWKKGSVDREWARYSKIRFGTFLRLIAIGR